MLARTYCLLIQRLASALFLLILCPGLTAAESPDPRSVAGDLREGGVVVVRGAGFGTKAHARPLFWWTADGGDRPSPLGRLKDWSSGWGAGNERQDVVVAPGSRQSYRFDHGRSSSAALGRIDFESPRVYLWRKKYDGFDITREYAIRVNVRDVVGTFQPGQTVRGAQSGATGVLVQVASTLLRFDNDGGTINRNPAVDFVAGETIVGPTGSAINDEKDGVFRSFNWKTMRFWHDSSHASGKNNVHANAQGLNGFGFRVTPEYTDSTRYYNAFLRQLPYEWANEQVVYEASDIDLYNGRFWFGINNEFGYGDLIRTRTASLPNRYAQIFQSQVSHLGQPESYAYYDSLYVDDSWHRVLLSSASSWADARDVEVQIPITWSSGEIEFSLRYGSLSTNAVLYLYVVDGENRVNTTGLPLVQLRTPKPPGDVRVE